MKPCGSTTASDGKALFIESIRPLHGLNHCALYLRRLWSEKGRFQHGEWLHHLGIRLNLDIHHVISLYFITPMLPDNIQHRK